RRPARSAGGAAETAPALVRGRGFTVAPPSPAEPIAATAAALQAFSPGSSCRCSSSSSSFPALLQSIGDTDNAVPMLDQRRRGDIDRMFLFVSEGQRTGERFGTTDIIR
ncbi:MAG: hypothetical protein MZV65_02535, partial [Chromatiales bacterium]|nr:hypothetical protein [Chromatiales bacterium]